MQQRTRRCGVAADPRAAPQPKQGGLWVSKSLWEDAFEGKGAAADASVVVVAVGANDRLYAGAGRCARGGRAADARGRSSDPGVTARNVGEIVDELRRRGKVVFLCGACRRAAAGAGAGSR